VRILKEVLRSVTNFAVILDDLGDVKNMRKCSFMDSSEMGEAVCMVSRGCTKGK
jgi:hypothetical protein